MQAKISHLWWGSEVDDALQLDQPSEVLHQEGVPVLVDCPLCRVDRVQLKKVQGKDVSDRRQKRVDALNEVRRCCVCWLFKCF